MTRTGSHLDAFRQEVIAPREEFLQEEIVWEFGNHILKLINLQINVVKECLKTSFI